MLVSTVRYNEKNAYLRISERVLQVLPSEQPKITILCIGTDRVTGDCFGPLVGTFLKSMGLQPLGTLEQPVHAGNLAQYMKEIPPDEFVLAIDACLGNIKSVGQINFYHGPITPGAAVGKKLDSVGDCGITMTVNVGGFMDNLVLANTRLSIVFSGAQATALGIYRALTIQRNARRAVR